MAFKMGTGYVDLVARDRVLQGQLAGLQGRMMGMMSGLTTGLGIVGVAAAAAAVISTKAFAKFEQQMANVSTMLDEQNMKLMPEYSAQVKAMAKASGQSTEAISGGLYDILSASVDASKALDVLDISLKAAVAGMTDTKTAADGLTTVINSYGLAAEDAGKVSDIMFQIVKRGKTTFPELASNIGKVASLAAVAGMSLEELGAGLATLTRGGLQTQIATRGMRALLNTIIKGGGPEAAKVAKELGVSLNVATLQAIGLGGILKKLKGASIEQLSALMPNVQGLSAFATALQQAEGFGEDYESMLRSSGSMMRAYAKMTDTLTFKFKKLWQTIKIGFINLGEQIAPVVGPMIDSLTKLLDGLFAKVTAFFVDNKDTILKWASYVKWAFTNMKDIGTAAFFTLSARMVSFGEDVKYLFTTKIPAVLKWLSGKWAEVFLTIYDYTSTIFKNLWTNIKNFFKAVWNWFTGDKVKQWEFVWKPMMDGFKSSMSEFPGIAERAMTEVEKKLAEKAKAASAKVKASFEETFGEKEVKALEDATDEVIKAGDPTVSKGAAGVGGGGAGKGTGGGSVMTGLSEMWEKIAGASLETETLQVSKSMLKELKLTRQDIKKQNLDARQQHEEAIQVAKKKRKAEGALVRSA